MSNVAEVSKEGSLKVEVASPYKLGFKLGIGMIVAYLAFQSLILGMTILVGVLASLV